MKYLKYIKTIAVRLLFVIIFASVISNGKAFQYQLFTFIDWTVWILVLIWAIIGGIVNVETITKITIKGDDKS